MNTRILSVKAKPVDRASRRIVVQRAKCDTAHRASPLIVQPRASILTARGDAALVTAHANLMIQAKTAGPLLSRGLLCQLQRQYGNNYVQRVLAVSTQGHGQIDNFPKTVGPNFGGRGMQADSLHHPLGIRAFTTARYAFLRGPERCLDRPTDRKLTAHEPLHLIRRRLGGHLIKTGVPSARRKVAGTLQRTPKVCKGLGSPITVPSMVTTGATRRRNLKLDQFTCVRGKCRITKSGKRIANPKKHYIDLKLQRDYQKKYIRVLSKYATNIANLKKPYSHFKKTVEDRDKKSVVTYMKVRGFKMVRVGKVTNPFFDWAAVMHEQQHVKLKRMKYREFHFKETSKLKQDAINEVKTDKKTEQKYIISTMPKPTGYRFIDKWRLITWKNKYSKRLMALSLYTRRYFQLLLLDPRRTKRMLAHIKKHRKEVGKFSAKRYRELNRFISSFNHTLAGLTRKLQRHWQKWHNIATNYVCDDLAAYKTSLQAIKRALNFIKQCCWPRKSRRVVRGRRRRSARQH